jgi:hypothetical protein
MMIGFRTLLEKIGVVEPGAKKAERNGQFSDLVQKLNTNVEQLNLPPGHCKCLYAHFQSKETQEAEKIAKHVLFLKANSAEIQKLKELSEKAAPINSANTLIQSLSSIVLIAYRSIANQANELTKEGETLRDGLLEYQRKINAMSREELCNCPTKYLEEIDRKKQQLSSFLEKREKLLREEKDLHRGIIVLKSQENNFKTIQQSVVDLIRVGDSLPQILNSAISTFNNRNSFSRKFKDQCIPSKQTLINVGGATLSFSTLLLSRTLLAEEGPGGYPNWAILSGLGVVSAAWARFFRSA